MNGTKLQAGSDLATVLYVEDDELTRAAVVWQLARAGFQVLEAGSGEDAIELADGEPELQLILLDIHLRGIDGVETARALRQTYPDVPLVVASCDVTPDLRRRLAPLAPAAVIPKPFHAVELIGILQGLLTE